MREHLELARAVMGREVLSPKTPAPIRTAGVGDWFLPSRTTTFLAGMIVGLGLGIVAVAAASSLTK